MGFESGATSISLLAACKRAKGLFQKAFIFGGNPEHAYDTLAFSKNLAAELLKETSTTTTQELQKIPTERLKDAAQKLSLNHVAAPTYDGKLIPKNIFKTYQGADIEFIIGIPSAENQIYKSFIGEQLFEKLVVQRFEGILSYLDKNNAQAVKDYIKNQKYIPETEAKSKFCEQWNALCMYFSAMQLSAAGNKVHLLYWNVNPVIENLGAGTVAVASAFLGNEQTSQIYGNVLDSNIFEIFQSFMKKFMKGESLQLYNNEIKGVNAINWEEFPKALVISDKNFKCELIEDNLTEIKSLLDFFKNISTH